MARSISRIPAIKNLDPRGSVNLAGRRATIYGQSACSKQINRRRLVFSLEPRLREKFENPFRNVVELGTRLTTIIAIKCKNGIVMAADMQATETRTWEYSIKVKEIDDFSLMACAGTGSYIEMFADDVRDAVETRGSRDSKKVLEAAVVSYSSYVDERIRKVGVGLTENDRKMCYPEAAFATNDRLSKRNRIFEIKTPHPPFEPDYQQRVTVGSGSLSAVAFLKNMEYFMAKFGLHWGNVSTRLASQLCWLLLNRVEHVDPSTSGVLLYRIDDSGTLQLNSADVWGDQDEESWATIVLRTAISEISEENLQRVIRRIGLFDLFKKP